MPPSTLLLTTAFWYTSFYLLCFSHCQFNWCNIIFVTLVLIRMKDVCYCFLKYTIIYGKVWLILVNIVTLNHLFTVYICIIFVSICPCAEGLHCLTVNLLLFCCSGWPSFVPVFSLLCPTWGLLVCWQVRVTLCTLDTISTIITLASVTANTSVSKHVITSSK